jgi:hypothetical protein
MTTAELSQGVLTYFVLPLWLVAGFADYLCHRASHIEQTSGAKESLAASTATAISPNCRMIGWPPHPWRGGLQPLLGRRRSEQAQRLARTAVLR